MRGRFKLKSPAFSLKFNPNPKRDPNTTFTSPGRRYVARYDNMGTITSGVNLPAVHQPSASPPLLPVCSPHPPPLLSPSFIHFPSPPVPLPSPICHKAAAKPI